MGHSIRGLDKVISIPLYLISLVGSGWVFVMLHGALKAALVRFFPRDPQEMINTAYRIALLERGALLILAIGLLASATLLYYLYTSARTRRQLLLRFARVSAIELVLIAIGYLTPRLLIAP